MILILDNLVNNYLNILSCLILLITFNLNKEKYLILLLIDILLNKIPIISIILIIIFLLNKFIFKRIVRNKLNNFIFLSLYYFIFISLLYSINEYKFDYLYYMKSNLISHVYNIIIYFLYIFYK